MNTLINSLTATGLYVAPTGTGSYKVSKTPNASKKFVVIMNDIPMTKEQVISKLDALFVPRSKKSYAQAQANQNQTWYDNK